MSSASVFGNSDAVLFFSASLPPNNSFKPTPCRGVGRVLCATLARVRRPATGRLNSGVRRRERNSALVGLSTQSHGAMLPYGVLRFIFR